MWNKRTSRADCCKNTLYFNIDHFVFSNHKIAYLGITTLTYYLQSYNFTENIQVDSCSFGYFFLSVEEDESGEDFDSGLDVDSGFDVESDLDSDVDSGLESGFDSDFVLELEDVLDFL